MRAIQFALGAALPIALSTSVVLGATPQYSPDAVLLRTPDVSETQVVFVYSGDLWLAPRVGGDSTRLTSAEGSESLPKFSPDGTKVAFMADYDGGTDIYVMDVAGGAPTRITFHPGRETLTNWHPSGDSVLYFSSESSGIARAPKIFRQSIDGGSPEVMPIPYGTFCEIDPSGTWLAYTPLSREGRTWRRYRGGMAQDIWLFNLETNESRRVTSDPGTDRMPMWYGTKLIFQSDRGAEGIANFYEYDPASGSMQNLTTFTSSGARFPSIGPLDVVFEQGGGLFRYVLDSGEIERIVVTIPGDRPSLRPIARDVASAATNATVSRTGKRIAVEARGEIFSVPTGDGATRNLTRTDGIAERAPSLGPNGRWLAYWSDRSGEYELTLRRVDGATFDGADENGERTLTATGGGWKEQASWSPDGERVAWSDHNGKMWTIDVDAGPDTAPVLVGEGYSPQYMSFDWSPDSSWITYSTKSTATDLEALYLFHVDSAQRHEVTSGLFDDSEPVFSRCGKWLFFHSSRTFSPSYADMDSTWIYDESRNLMALRLAEETELPWAPSNDEEEEVPADDESEDAGKDADGEDAPGDSKSDDSSSDDGDSEGDDSAGDSDEAAAEEGDAKEDGDEEDDDDDRTVIDLDGLESRVVMLPVDPGVAGGLVGLDGGLLFAVRGERSADIHRFDMESHEDGAKKVFGPARGYDLTADGEKLLVRSGSRWGLIAPKPGQKMEDAVDLSGLRGRFDPREEWPQMIRDIHRLYRDWFYDAGMHGVDWDGIRDKTLASLSDATSRADVHFLIGEMLAELNVGHAYNRPPAGGFGGASNALPTGLLGADWTPVDGGFRVDRVLGSSIETDAHGPLHGQAKAGDVLTAIDGSSIDSSRSIHEHLMGAAGRTVVLTFQRDGEDREVIAEPIRSERSLRYRDWVAKKRAAVHAASNGRIGYVHVPSTGIDGQNELYRQFLSERSRGALIVDERWNSGGQIPTRFIELLSRKPTNMWAMRDGRIFEWPPTYHDGPKAMLINHSAGSGGDAFPWYFRRMGLGPLIGTRTWGGLVGISGNPALIDGASPSVPTFGFFELDGTWGVEGHGVDPDIEVIDDPALMVDGSDPQLERAMAELTKAMETWEYAKKERPGSPNRAGAGLPDSDK